MREQHFFVLVCFFGLHIDIPSEKHPECDVYSQKSPNTKTKSMFFFRYGGGYSRLSEVVIAEQVYH